MNQTPATAANSSKNGSDKKNLAQIAAPQFGYAPLSYARHL